MMILSASRREDMPAFRMGEILSKYEKYGKEAFWVLWTKNPEHIVGSGMDFRMVSLHLTVTGFGSTRLEPNVPEPPYVWEKARLLVEAGFNPNLITWRLDPLIPGDLLQTAPHIERLARQASRIGITRCVTSFVTLYRHVRERWPEGSAAAASIKTQRNTALGVREILSDHGIGLYGCAQPHLADIIKPSSCIDGSHLSATTHMPFTKVKDGAQRSSCRCTASVDIGSYSRCHAGCLYCYATKPPTQGSLFQPGQPKR